MTFTDLVWEDAPSTDTPMSAANLNRLETYLKRLSRVTPVVPPPSGVAATDRANINAAIADVAADGGRVVLQPILGGQVYLTDQEIVVPGGVTLAGCGMDLSGRHGGTQAPGRGSILRATGAMDAVVVLGDIAANTGINSTYDTGHTGAAIDRIVIDGANLATAAVEAIGGRWLIDHAQVMRGTDHAFLGSTGQNGYAEASHFFQDNRGNVVSFVGGVDNKIKLGQLRGMGQNKSAVYIEADAVEVAGVHLFRNSTQSAHPHHGITIVKGSRHRFVDNTLDQTIGHHFNISPADNIDSVVIAGNTMYWLAGDGSAYVDDTYSCIAFDCSTAYSIRAFTIVGNIGRSDLVTKRYKAFLRKFGATGTLSEIVATGNVVRNAVAFADFAYTDGGGNVAWTA